jgi:phage portal protein BeeE
MDANHSGTTNAYKTLYLGAGADVKVIGSNLDQLSFKSVQGAGETRIAAASGVPASILGISEGLAGSALNSGNYTATRRRFADGTMRPLWRAAAASLQTLVPPPDRTSRLWFDDRDVAFLQEDVMDAAQIRNSEASTIESLIRSGFVPDTCVDAVITGDYTRLVHTGLYSVQLQPPQNNQPSE